MGLTWWRPLRSWAWLLGRPYPFAQLWEACRLLLQNHAHDSICGCSVDQVHREMMARFSQVQQIDEWIVEKSLHTWAIHVDTSWCTPGSTPLVILNPLGQPRHEVVVATLRWPRCAEHCRAVSYRGQVSDV